MRGLNLNFVMFCRHYASKCHVRSVKRERQAVFLFFEPDILNCE